MTIWVLQYDLHFSWCRAPVFLLVLVFSLFFFWHSWFIGLYTINAKIGIIDISFWSSRLITRTVNLFPSWLGFCVRTCMLYFFFCLRWPVVSYMRNLISIVSFYSWGTWYGQHQSTMCISWTTTPLCIGPLCCKGAKKYLMWRSQLFLQWWATLLGISLVLEPRNSTINYLICRSSLDRCRSLYQESR